MAETTDSYFERLAKVGRQPLLHLVTGTMRCDIQEPDGSHRRWRLAIDHGRLDVHAETEAVVDVDVDCSLSGPEEEFCRIVSGQDSLVAAAVRGAITVTGDLIVAQSFRRFSPPAQIVAGDAGDREEAARW